MGGFEGFDDGVAKITSSGNPPLLALVGEIDEGVSAGFAAALEQAAAGYPEIHVTMAGLSYCDLAGLRAIVRLTQDRTGAAETGRRRVVLYDVPPQVRAVLRIVGWDRLPGLTLGGRRPAGTIQPAASPAQPPARASQPSLRATQPTQPTARASQPIAHTTQPTARAT